MRLPDLRVRVPTTHFEPWVGFVYRTGHWLGRRRVLVVGESHYLLHGKGDCKTLTEETVDWFGPGAGRNKFFTVLTRLLAGRKMVSDRIRRLLWESVAFYNYVQVAVGNGPRVRPADWMWDRSRVPFQRVVRKTSPRRIIIVGKELWGRLEDDEVIRCSHRKGESWPRSGYLMHRGVKIRVLGIPHPSGGRFVYRGIASHVRRFVWGS